MPCSANYGRSIPASRTNSHRRKAFARKLGGPMPCRAASLSRDCARQRRGPHVFSATLRSQLPQSSLLGATARGVNCIRRPARHPPWRGVTAWRRMDRTAAGEPSVPSPARASCATALLYIGLQERGRPRGVPETPPEPQLCAECEDDAEREIVLDTARGGAYYSILRQARKRLSESRGGHPRRREP